MSRAAAVVLLLAFAALVPPAEAQPPGYVIPTQQDQVVGGLNLTAWIMRDTRTISYTPDLRSNPLGYLWNLNFTAGSLGIAYVKATPVEVANYTLEMVLRSSSPDLQVVEPLPNQTTVSAQTGACAQTGDTHRCSLPDNATGADATFQFFIASSARPGPLPLTLEVKAFRNVSGSLQTEGSHTFRYTLDIIDPLPPFAVRAEVGDTTLGAWTNGGPLGITTGGCLGGSAVGRDENVTNGAPAVICLVAVTRSEAMLRISGTLRGPEWFIAPEESWTSEPFNVTSGGVSAPVHGFAFQTNGVAPLGQATATLRYRLERQVGGAWEPAGEGEMAVPFHVQTGPLVVKGPATLNLVAHAPLLLASVAGLGYLAYTGRKPKFSSRSQAMKAEQVHRKVKDDSAAQQVIAEQQRAEVQEAAWSKKRQILEAKREDILKSIRIAEERHQRGEVTEHVLKGIRERKERQLEQVQKEMEEQGQ